MKINNYLQHKIEDAAPRRPAVYQKTSEAYICFHRLCVFSPLFVAEIAAFTDDRQFESALVE